MKDVTQQELEESRPHIDVDEGIDGCLNALFKDKKHKTTEEIVRGLTFEELIGVLLLARDEIKSSLQDYPH